jgi:hypothetical protein
LVEEKELASLRKEYLREREYLKNPAKESIDWDWVGFLIIAISIVGFALLILLVIMGLLWYNIL